MKRAFTQQAFRWHPDRRADLDEQARARADWRMRECNAAWAVLGTPATRAAYDDQLRAEGLLPPRPGEGSSAVRSSAGSAGRSSSIGRVPSPTDQLIEPARDFGVLVPRRHTGRWVAVGVVVVLLAAGAIAAVVAAQHDATPPADPELRTNAFEVGSCVTIEPGPVVSSVPCNQPNAGRIASTTDSPRPCPTGTQSLSLADQKLTLCLVDR